MSTIPAPNHVLPVLTSVTASPGAGHEGHTMMTLHPEVLRCDADVQPRLALSDAHIRAYAALLQEGHQLGRIVVFQDGSDYYLADGFHRVAAAQSIDLEELPAEIRVGTKRDARLYACGANKHGKPLSNPDKQRVVRHLLEDAEWGQWSDREIARHCGVGHALVSRLRRSLSPGDSDTAPRTYRTKHGTVTTMETRAIGTRAAPEVPGVAPHNAEVAADNTVREAVHDAAERHATPVAPDDSLHEGPTKDAAAARVAFPTRLSRLFDLLDALATFPALEQLLLDIPPDCYDRVDQYLDPAFATLNRLRTFRKEHQHDATAVRVPPRAPQRVRQPPKRKTRRKTKAQTRPPAQTAPATTETAPSQPALLLAAIRTAPQPLTIEDLRQLPGVDGRRAKRNVTRLVEQRKMQETPAGYVGVSP